MIEAVLKYIISRKKFNTVAVLVLCSVPISAQKTTIRTNDLLNQALGQTKEQILGKYNDALASLHYTLPLLEKIDIRTETERLTTTRQEFLVRTTFNSIKEKKALQQKQSALVSWKKNKETKEENEAILKRYRDINQWLHNQQEIDIATKKQMIQQYKIKMAEDILTAGQSFDLADYVDLKHGVFTLQEKITDLNFERQNILMKFGFKSTDVTILASDYIDVPAIKDMVNDLVLHTDNHYSLKEFDLEADFLFSSSQVEKARASKIINFAQAKYSVRDDLLLQNRFSIGMAFTVPWRGSTNNELNDIRIKEFAIKTDKDIHIYNLKEKFEEVKINLNQKLIQYQNYLNIIDDKDLNMLKTNILQSGRMAPIKILKMKEDELDILAKKYKLEYDIIDTYINLLHLSGTLYEQPYINYLSLEKSTF